MSPFAGVAAAAGVGRPTHFLCFACRRKRRRLRVGVLLVAAMLIGAAIGTSVLVGE